MFEEFYEMYESEEQEVVALINRCIGGGFNWKGNFWEMTVVTLGIVSCDTGKVMISMAFRWNISVISHAAFVVYPSIACVRASIPVEAVPALIMA